MVTADDAAEVSVQFEPTSYRNLPEWKADDHAAAVTVLDGAGLLAAADRLLAEASPREFFETRFVPHRVVQQDSPGLLTGYYEPVLQGSRTKSAAFPVPLYRQPDELVKIHEDAARGQQNNELVAGRMVDGALTAYFTRSEIECGALAGRGLEILYLRDAVDAFFLHVQGSGLIELDDGTTVRIGFAAKNGLTYTSIGRVLIERGEILAKDMTLAVLRDWLETHPSEAAGVMRENKSFIFFHEEAGPVDTDHGPTGSLGLSLTAGRSLAIDTSFHALGSPIYVSSGTLDCHGAVGFHRLMVAQDVGSAIRGPERGDIFWGTGDEAGRIAGETIHEGGFFVLLPRDVSKRRVDRLAR